MAEHKGRVCTRASADARSRPPPDPLAGVEFEKGWRTLRGDPPRQAAFLLLIPPAQLPRVLQQALTPPLLASAVGALLGPGLRTQPAAAAELLAALINVPRFFVNLMSLGARERAALGGAWDGAGV